MLDSTRMKRRCFLWVHLKHMQQVICVLGWTRITHIKRLIFAGWTSKTHTHTHTHTHIHTYTHTRTHTEISVQLSKWRVLPLATIRGTNRERVSKSSPQGSESGSKLPQCSSGVSRCEMEEHLVSKAASSTPLRVRLAQAKPLS